MGTIIKKAVLAVCIIDDYTGRMVYGSNIRVSANGFRAFRKDDGYYVFINLSGSNHEITVDSDIYFRETLPVDMNHVDRSNPIVFVRLVPNTIYPVPADAACIWGILSQGGVPAAGVAIDVENASEKERIKIAEDSAEAGSRELKLFVTGDMRLEGKLLTIYDTEKENREQCRVVGMEKGKYLLEKGLAHSHKRGVPLIPADLTYTDEKGRFLVLLKPFRKEKADVALRCETGGRVWKRKVSVANGETINLGTINVEGKE